MCLKALGLTQSPERERNGAVCSNPVCIRFTLCFRQVWLTVLFVTSHCSSNSVHCFAFWSLWFWGQYTQTHPSALSRWHTYNNVSLMFTKLSIKVTFILRWQVYDSIFRYKKVMVPDCCLFHTVGKSLGQIRFPPNSIAPNRWVWNPFSMVVILSLDSAANPPFLASLPHSIVGLLCGGFDLLKSRIWWCRWKTFYLYFNPVVM